jgi:hypothetical protein
MPSPTNTSATTATDLGALPASVSQNVHDAGTTYTVWYQHTAATTGVIGIWGFGDLSVYRPTIDVFTGPASSPVAYLTTSPITAQNKPVQLPVTAGTTYYFRFTPNAGNPTPAVLAIEAEAAPTGTARRGDIIITDDTFGFPGAIIDQDSGTVKGFVHPFAAGEAGDSLNGVLALEDVGDNEIRIFRRDFTQIAAIAVTPVEIAGSIRANKILKRFYALDRSSNPDQVLAIELDGSTSATHSLPGHNSDMVSLAVNNDGTIMYWGSTSANGIIHRWDLVNEVGLSDFANIGASRFVFDLFVLTDGTVLANFLEGNGSIVRRYSAAGALLNTYDFSTEPDLFGTTPRVAVIGGSDASIFLIGTHHDGGIWRFRRVRISDGEVLSSIDTVEYEGGVYQGDETANPVARFGASFSCPVIIWDGPDFVDPSIPEICCVKHAKPGCCSAGPTPQKGRTGKLRPAIEPRGTSLTPDSGNGRLLPSGADPVPPERWS